MSIDKRWVRWAALALVVLGLALLVLWGVRVYRHARSLVARLPKAQALAEGNPLEADPAAVGALLHGVRDDVVALRRDVGWLAKLAPALRWLPKVGPLAADAPDLLALADALTEAGVLLWDAGAPSLAAMQEGAAPLGLLPGALARLEPILPQARAAVDRAERAYAGLDVAALPYRLREPLAQLGELLPLLGDGLAWIEHAPELLGLDGPRTYLVLVINEDELRPGGGFITGVGEVTVAGGDVGAFKLSDSYAADDFSEPYPEAPEPLAQFMRLPLLVLRDSNWSPDFPTAARLAIELYRPGYPVEVAGVVGVDQRAVKDLVNALGPLAVEGAEEPVTGDTLLDYVYRTWAPEGGQIDREWWAQRKAFMEPLAEAVLARLKGGDVDWVALTRAALDLVAQKHLLVYLDDAEAQALLAAQGRDAGLRESPGDYLMVVEANVGFNKASPRIRRAYTYAVDLAPSPPEATLTLAYTHTSQVEIACESEARYDPVYVQMMDRCYWAYLRVYAPEGARLLDASRHPIPGEALASGEPWPGEALVQPAPEGPWTVLAQAFLLPTDATGTGSSAQVRFAYMLPEGVVQHEEIEGEAALVYRLVLQKQPGAPAVPTRVILRAPRNAVLWSASPQPLTAQDGVLLYEMDLAQDTAIVVRFREER